MSLETLNLEKTTFLYYWKNITNGKQYIGFHSGNENDGYVSSSKYFNKAYNERPQDFVRIIYQHGNRGFIQQLETNILHWLQARQSELYYNLTNGGGPDWRRIGPLSEETKHKISLAKKGQKRGPLTDKHKNAIGYANSKPRILPVTEECRNKISQANTGKKRTLKQRKNMLIAQQYRASLHIPISEELREIRRDAQLGRVHTAEHIAKRMAKIKGSKLSKKARINMKAGWIKRKQKQLNNYVNTSP